MNLKQIAESLKYATEPVLRQKIAQQDPMQSPIALGLLNDMYRKRAAKAAEQVAPIAQQPPVTQQFPTVQQPPVTQGLYPMIVQAAQNLQRQQAQAPTQGLGAVEPPVMMASGGIVSLQGGGDVLRQRLRNARARLELYGTRQRIADPEGYAAALKEYQELLSQSRGPEEPKEPEEPEPTPGEVEAASRPFFGGRPVLPVGSRVPLPPSRLDAASPIEVTGTPRLSPQRPPAAPAGPRPPSTARPAVPGGVTMTTPEMGPPRPDAGIASLVSAAQPMMPAAPIPREDYEGTIARLSEQARPAPAPTEEEILDRQSELERKYGVRPQGEQMIQIMQQQLERARKEREQIPRKSLEAAIAGMQGRDLAGMLGSARAAGAGYQQSAEAASQQAEIIYEQAIAKYQDAENERKRGKINEARKKREDAEKLMQQYFAKLAEAQVTGYGQSVQRQVEREGIAQRAAEAAARDRRERELKEAEFVDIERRDERRFEREKALEKLRQSGRVGVGGAGSGVAQGRLDLATTRERATRIEKVLEALVAQNNLTPPAQRKTLDQLYADAERVVRSRYPELFAGEAASSGAAGRGTAPTSVGSYDPSKPADQRVRLPNQ